ncbi:MAG: alpha/beta fold hydrolase, partial [Gammaproteobacteria bacterium]
MKLYTQTSGAGPDLLLVHGWGLHSGIWDGLAPLLEPHYRVTRMDLPGHGRSAWQGQASLDDMTDAVLSTAPATAVWLGWSLGGLLAARAAQRAPARVTALVL